MKRKKIISISSIIIIVISFIGCASDDITYINPITSKALSFYCVFNPDSLWNVQICKLGSVYDTESDSLYINDATVELYKDDELIDTLKNYKLGSYKSTKNLYPEYDNEYYIKVKKDGYENIVTDKEKLPGKLNIIDWSVSDEIPTDTFPAEVYSLDIWYKLKMITVKAYITKNQYIQIKSIQSSSDKEETVEMSNDAVNNFIEYTSDYSTILKSLKTGIVTLKFCTSVKEDYIQINSITEAFQKYELSKTEYDFVISTAHFLNPNNLYSNVSGGAGLFLGATFNIIKIQ